jgi:hypothetical protein
MIFFDAAFSSELQGPAVLADELNAIVAGTALRWGLGSVYVASSRRLDPNMAVIFFMMGVSTGLPLS